MTAGALLAPSSNQQVYDGLPLSHPAEYVLAVLLVLVVAPRAVRRLAAGELGRRAWLHRGLLIAAGTVLALKAMLFASGDHRGWRACYASPLAAPPAGRCEGSFENPAHRFGVTRIDERIDFVRDSWHLTFFNDNRFNIPQWVASSRRRDRLPITVTWMGNVHAPMPLDMVVDYVGQGQLTAGAERVALAPAYDRAARSTVRLPAGVHAIRLAYAFDDDSRVRDRITGPYARVHVRFLDGGGSPVPVTVGPPRPSIGLRVAAALADGLVVLIGLAPLALLGGLLARDWWRFLLVAGAVVATPAVMESATPPVASLKAVVASSLVLLWVLQRRRARDVPAASLALLALGAAVFLPLYGSTRAVVLRTAGDDWLTYESLARSVLDTWSLEGGEPVFYYQPLFRYIRFVERLLLGDGDLLVISTAFSMLLLSIVLAVRALARGRSPHRQGVCALAGLLMMVLVCARTGAVRFLVLGASEYPTWILLPPLLASLFSGRRRAAALGGAAMLGASALTRLNHLPALLAIHAAFVWRSRRRRGIVLPASAVLVCILLLPLAHNLYYGGALQPLTSSGGIPENYVLPPSAVAAAVSDSAWRDTLMSQLRFVVGTQPIEHDWLLRPALRGLQALWLGVIVWTLATRRLSGWRIMLALTPALYLGTHLVYQVHVYYPRHILAGHLMMGMVAVTLVGDRRCAGVPPDAEDQKLDAEPSGNSRTRVPAVTSKVRSPSAKRTLTV